MDVLCGARRAHFRVHFETLCDFRDRNLIRAILATALHALPGRPRVRSRRAPESAARP